MSRSSRSRLFHGMYVDDITDEAAAVDYLTCMCPSVSEHRIATAVRLVGRRFSDLGDVITILLDGGDLEKYLFNNIKQHLDSMRMETIPVLHDNIIMQSILKSPNNKISLDTYNSLVSMLNEDDRELIENNDML